MQDFKQWYSKNSQKILGGPMPAVLNPLIEKFSQECWEAAAKQSPNQEVEHEQAKSKKCPCGKVIPKRHYVCAACYNNPPVG